MQMTSGKVTFKHKRLPCMRARMQEIYKIYCRARVLLEAQFLSVLPIPAWIHASETDVLDENPIDFQMVC